MASPYDRADITPGQLGYFLFIVAVVCLFIGFSIGNFATTAREQATAIQHNAGYYDMTTGQFHYGVKDAEKGR